MNSVYIHHKPFQKILRKCKKSGDLIDKDTHGGYTITNSLGQQILKAIRGSRGYVVRYDPKYFDQQTIGE